MINYLSLKKLSHELEAVSPGGMQVLLSNRNLPAETTGHHQSLCNVMARMLDKAEETQVEILLCFGILLDDPGPTHSWPNFPHRRRTECYNPFWVPIGEKGGE